MAARTRRAHPDAALHGGHGTPAAWGALTDGRNPAFRCLALPHPGSAARPRGTLTAEGPEAELRLMTEFAPFTSLFNVTGHPSLSIPLHRTGTGLPIGVMLTGRPGEEGTLLSLSAQLEEARPWAHRSPPDEHG